MIELGDQVKDPITGFKGIAVGRSDFLYGCIRFGVQSEKLEDGKPLDTQWFDEGQLVVTKKAAVSYQPVDAGGPRRAPQRRVDPKR